VAIDPTGWFLTSQALDHHAGVLALTEAAPEAVAYADDPAARTGLAEHLATELARAGYALVRLTPEAEITQDLTAQVDAFLARKED
jgi:hypothetical protein